MNRIKQVLNGFNFLKIDMAYMQTMQRYLQTAAEALRPYRTILSVFLIACFCVFGMRFEYLNEVKDLDPSWGWALNVVQLTQKYKFGTDVFFTYGPLGFLIYPMQGTALIYWALVLKIAVVFLFAGALWSFKNKENYLFFLLLFVAGFVLFGCRIQNSIFVGSQPTFEILALLLAYAYLNTKKIRWFFCLNVIGVVIFFAKLNLGLLYLGTVTFLLPFEKDFIKKILTAVAVWGLGFVLMTVCFLGGFDELLSYLNVSFEIADYYSESMSMTMFGIIPSREALLICLDCLLIFWLGFDDFKNKKGSFKYFFVLMPALFFVFKSSVVRYEGLHIIVFFEYMLAVVSLLYVMIGNINKKILGFIYVVSIISLMRYLSFGSIVWDLATLDNSKLPEVDEVYNLSSGWKRTIGSKKIEALPFNMSYIQKNNLTASFNPVFQLYSVYSKHLDDLSAAHYQARKTDFIIIGAPEGLHNCGYMDLIVELKKHGIVSQDNKLISTGRDVKWFKCVQTLALDGRNFLWDTPHTWRVVRENYVPAKVDKDKILLQKRERKIKEVSEPIKKEKVKFNEQFKIPAGAQILEADIEYSWIGKLVKLFFQIPPMYVIAESGKEVYTYRQIRDVLKNGIFIGFLTVDAQDIKDYFSFGRGRKKIADIGFYTPFKFLYKSDIEVVWKK